MLPLRRRSQRSAAQQQRTRSKEQRTIHSRRILNSRSAAHIEHAASRGVTERGCIAAAARDERAAAERSTRLHSQRRAATIVEWSGESRATAEMSVRSIDAAFLSLCARRSPRCPLLSPLSSLADSVLSSARSCSLFTSASSSSCADVRSSATIIPRLQRRCICDPLVRIRWIQTTRSRRLGS